MKSKKTIIDKTVYGGTLVDKYFFIFDDGSDMQISPDEWDQYKVGEEYPKEESSEAVNKICKQIEEIYREKEYLKQRCHILEIANKELDLEVKRLKGDKS